MSIKIFNGFKFLDTDLSTIHQHIMDWRKELRPLHQKAIESFVGGAATSLFDAECIRPGSQAGKMPLMEALSQLWDRQAEVRKTQRRDPLVDFEFSISLMPFEGQVYGITYTEQHAWQRLWMQKPFVADYAYWNNTDAPEEITEDDWDERGRVWNSIFAKAIMSAPSMAGFNVDCTHDGIMPDTSRVIEVLPTFEERVQRHAKNSCLAILAQRLRQERGEPADSLENTAYLMDALRMLDDPETEELLEEEKQRFSSILVRDFTRDMLLKAL